MNTCVTALKTCFQPGATVKKKLTITVGIVITILVLFSAGLLGWFALAEPTTLTGGPIDPERLNEGEFEGHFRSGPNRAHVKITVADGKLTKIEVLRNVASWIGKKANPAVPDRIVALQSTKVDAVTGATHSSRVIMNAVETAMQKSYRNGE
jgi:uncharacterized protein with FMN-binding domain